MRFIHETAKTLITIFLLKRQPFFTRKTSTVPVLLGRTFVIKRLILIRIIPSPTSILGVVSFPVFPCPSLASFYATPSIFPIPLLGPIKTNLVMGNVIITEIIRILLPPFSIIDIMSFSFIHIIHCPDRVRSSGHAQTYISRSRNHAAPSNRSHDTCYYLIGV